MARLRLRHHFLPDSTFRCYMLFLVTFFANLFSSGDNIVWGT